jgi:hypothetical protein
MRCNATGNVPRFFIARCDPQYLADPPNVVGLPHTSHGGRFSVA